MAEEVKYINREYIAETDTMLEIHDIRVPEVTSNDAGKVLAVNGGATGLEWITNSGGGGVSVPTPTSADENKLLSVNSSGQYVLVTIVNSENVAY